MLIVADVICFMCVKYHNKDERRGEELLVVEKSQHPLVTERNRADRARSRME